MELKKKGVERSEFSPIKFSKQIKTISDLRERMILPEVVDNVVDFGSFIDIGIKQKGLVYISEISDKFANNIHDFLLVGDKISVNILEIDKNRNRISLSTK